MFCTKIFINQLSPYHVRIFLLFLK